MLPELKSGDVLITAGGRKVVVWLLKKPRRDTGFQEPLYSIMHLLPNGRQIKGNAEWTLDELNAAGMKLA